MPETDGPTCATCLTLNPVGAPACIRCNSPLPADPLPAQTSPARVPPVQTQAVRPVEAVAPAGPGAVAVAAAAPPRPARPVSGPADPPRVRRRVAVAGGVLVALVLGAGSAGLWLTRPRYLDPAPLARTLGAELTTRFGEPVTVSCREAPRLRAGERFSCSALTGQGLRRQVLVTLLDEAGRYRWEFATSP